MIDKHNDSEFLEAAKQGNIEDKPLPVSFAEGDYTLGNVKTYKDIPGWINGAEWIYERMVDESEDGDQFLEIGTFFGQSAARMCELIRDSGKDLKFYSMDVYYEIESSLAMGRHPQTFKDFRDFHSYTDIYNLVSNIFDYMGLKKYVELICCDSKYGYKLFDNETFKMVYVDGNHYYENVYNDLVNFFPKVKKNGYIICDDVVYESVTDAIETFCQEFNISKNDVEYNNNSCIIKKI